MATAYRQSIPITKQIWSPTSRIRKMPLCCPNTAIPTILPDSRWAKRTTAGSKRPIPITASGSSPGKCRAKTVQICISIRTSTARPRTGRRWTWTGSRRHIPMMSITACWRRPWARLRPTTHTMPTGIKRQRKRLMGPCSTGMMVLTGWRPPPSRECPRATAMGPMACAPVRPWTASQRPMCGTGIRSYWSRSDQWCGSTSGGWIWQRWWAAPIRAIISTTPTETWFS